MKQTMEAEPTSTLPTTYKQITPELYTEFKRRYLAGGQITKLAKEYGVSLGAIAGRLSRDENAREERESTREAVQKTVLLRAGQVSAAVGRQVSELYSMTLETAMAATKRAKALIVAADDPIKLRMAAEAYETPSRLVIDMLALGKFEPVEKSGSQTNIALQVGNPSRNTDVIECSPVLAS